MKSQPIQDNLLDTLNSLREKLADIEYQIAECSCRDRPKFYKKHRKTEILIGEIEMRIQED